MIELDNVSKIYRMGEVEVGALQNVSMRIDDGEIAAIMGPSGSGKSTMMNIIGCLDVPSEGRYLLDDLDVGQLGDDRLAEIRGGDIGFVFQTYNLLPRLTAQANVELPLIYGGRRDRHRNALDALDRVGLADRANHRPTELSGGQQQRVGIARALVKEPRILLADEPTGNLDSRSSEEIIEILRNLNEEDGITVILVTHEPDIAAHARRVVSMLDGRIVTDQVQKQLALGVSFEPV